MRKNDLKTRHLLGVVMFAAAMLFASCDDLLQEEFQPGQGVTDAQLESPDMTKAKYKVVSGKLQVTWPYVKGAGGYEISAVKTGFWDSTLTDAAGNPAPAVVPIEPAEPVSMVAVDETAGEEPVYTVFVDGTTYSFPIEYLYEYKVSVRALGRKDLNNKDAIAAASGERFLNRVGVEYIPVLRDEASGEALETDLATLIPLLLGDDPEDSTPLKVVLEPGGKYVVNGPLDFGLHRIYFFAGVSDGAGDYTYSDERALITMVNAVDDDGKDVAGQLFTAAGLEITGINFDCTAMMELVKKPNHGFITMSPVQHASAVNTTSLADAGNTYLCEDPIIVKNCNIKNVPGSFFSPGLNAWAIEAITIDNCIVQVQSIVTGDGAGFIDFYQGAGTYVDKTQTWRGMVRETTITNSTIYNIEDANTRFVRNCNADVKRHFANTNALFRMTNVTLHHFTEYDQFANNPCKASDGGKYIIDMNNCIFYDTYGLRRILNGGENSNTSNPITNVIYSIAKTGADNSDSAYATIDDTLEYTGSELTELDLTDDLKGGQNFTYTWESDSTAEGDPRWK